MTVFLSVYRRILDSFPSVDPHEFATAYVNHVEQTGDRPSVLRAITSFSREGVIS